MCLDRVLVAESRSYMCLAQNAHIEALSCKYKFANHFYHKSISFSRSWSSINEVNLWTIRHNQWSFVCHKFFVLSLYCVCHKFVTSTFLSGLSRICGRPAQHGQRLDGNCGIQLSRRSGQRSRQHQLQGRTRRVQWWTIFNSKHSEVTVVSLLRGRREWRTLDEAEWRSEALRVAHRIPQAGREETQCPLVV